MLPADWQTDRLHLPRSPRILRRPPCRSQSCQRRATKLSKGRQNPVTTYTSGGTGLQFEDHRSSGWIRTRNWQRVNARRLVCHPLNSETGCLFNSLICIWELEQDYRPVGQGVTWTVIHCVNYTHPGLACGGLRVGPAWVMVRCAERWRLPRISAERAKTPRLNAKAKPSLHTYTVEPISGTRLSVGTFPLYVEELLYATD